MPKIISAPGGPLSGTVSLPGDKSISHRAALFAALAEGESRIDNFLVAGVTETMLKALADLGVQWKLEGNRLVVHGRGFNSWDQPTEPFFLDCANSGTTLRLLTGALAALGLPAVLDGSTGLRRRPMRRIVSPLQTMGAAVQTSSDGTAPLRLLARSQGHQLRALDCALPVASAQVKSCLLLAALAADSASFLREPGPSRDHSERMLRSMGVEVTSTVEASDVTSNTKSVIRNAHYVTRLEPPRPLQLSPLNLVIPGDVSSAAFLIVAAAVTPGSRVTLKDAGLNPTRTGLLDALQSMGADIRVFQQEERSGEPVGDIEVSYAPLQGTQVSGSLVVRMIDEFPIFAVAASCAGGQTRVSQAEELRHKESDRISALCTELRKLGIDSRETRDGFVIDGDNMIQGGVVEAHGDHRLAMALAVAGLVSKSPVIVDGAQILTESFPEFSTKLRDLGADIRIEV